MVTAKRTAKRSVKYPWIVDDLQPLAVPVESLRLDPKNARAHVTADIRAIGESLKRYKQRTPLVVNRKTKHIAKGNGTYLAARSLGWSHIAVVFVEDDPAAHAGYTIADNRTAELSAWNEALLDELLLSYPDELDGGFKGDLLLDELLATKSRDKKNKEDDRGDIPETFQLIVTCRDEVDQQAVYERLTRDGYTCKVLTL